MTHGQHHDGPYANKPVEQLQPAEWRALIDWRMVQLEKRLDSLIRAIVTVGGVIFAGVVVYVFTVVIAGSSAG